MAIVALVATGGVVRASAATITEPAAAAIVASVDSSHHLVPIKVSAKGFPQNTPVFVEQCDGTSPTEARWSPTEHCDLGSSPAADNADANGAVAFDPADSSHTFVPFVGESPQSIFNCNPAAGPAPNNGLPNFTRCQLRVSSNNTIVTADQQFISLTLPAGARDRPPAPTTTTTRATPTTLPAVGSSTKNKTGVGVSGKSSSSKPSTAAAKGAAVAVPQAAASSSSSSSGLLSLSDPGVIAGYLFVLLGLAAVAYSVRMSRWRSSQVANRE